MEQAIVASADNSSPLENVRDKTRGRSATVAWPGQACAAQLEVAGAIVLFITRYP